MATDALSTELQIEIDPNHVAQCLIRDPYTGDWSKKQFKWRGSVDLKWNGKEVGAVVTAKDTVEDRSDEGREKWAQALAHAAASFVKSQRLSIFQENDVTEKLPTNRPVLTQISVSVPDEYRQKLEQEREVHVLAQKSFKHAVERLKNYADYPPHSGFDSDGPLMYAYLRNCLDAADLRLMYSWYQEKMSGISSSMSDLAKRKNRNHPGFKSSQEYMRSNLFSFSPPDLWIRRPPTMSVESMTGS